MGALIKLLPYLKHIKTIYEYVFNENNLDLKVKKIDSVNENQQAHLKELDTKVELLFDLLKKKEVK